MSKVSKIDQIHIRAIMLCMSKNFLNIQPIFNPQKVLGS